MPEQFQCENPNCRKRVHRRTVAVDVRDLWQCGDHDERVLTKAFIACSWACLAALACDLATEEAASEPSAVAAPGDSF